MTTITDMDLIERTAEKAADWWTERMMAGDKIAFKDSLKAAIEHELRDRNFCFVECDYDPRGILLDAVRAAGLECRGFMFSSRNILPEKHSTKIKPGAIIPKEGYGYWTAEIEIK